MSTGSFHTCRNILRDLPKLSKALSQNHEGIRLWKVVFVASNFAKNRRRRHKRESSFNFVWANQFDSLSTEFHKIKHTARFVHVGEATKRAQTSCTKKLLTKGFRKTTPTFSNRQFFAQCQAWLLSGGVTTWQHVYPGSTHETRRISQGYPRKVISNDVCGWYFWCLWSRVSERSLLVRSMSVLQQTLRGFE
jgi:ribosomal protein L39E